MQTRLLRFTLFSILIASLTLPGLSNQARAVETYSMVSSPSRIVESPSLGVIITVTIYNAVYSPPTPYVFSWAVRDPSGTSRSVTSNAVSQTPSWSFSVNYPTNFSGASLNLPGIYSVNVSQTLPASRPNAVTGTFTVGITDSSTYQRTYAVGLQAAGYLPTDAVNVTIVRSGNPVPAFSVLKTADSNGVVAASWQTFPSTTTGNYVVMVVGKNTPPKAVPDMQQFVVYPTNITTTGLTAGKTSLERTETEGFRFNGTYLSGVSTIQGTSKIRLIEPDGSTIHFTTASYNSTLGTFSAVYTIPISSGTGAWIASLDQNNLTDPYGNGGPPQSKSLVFNVLPAVLSVALLPSSTVIGVGETLTIQASVRTPNSAIFSQGTAVASITISGRSVGSGLTLTYDPTRGQWIGNYKVAPSDPSGAWLVTVSASDSYGNIGQSSVVVSVNVPIAQTSNMLWSYVVIVLMLGLLGFIILITRKRGSTRREVKLDLTAIKTQADKVKGDDFLQSIHDQLQKKKKEVGIEKKDHD